MRRKLNRALSLLSLPAILLINAIAVVEPTLAQPSLVKQEVVVAQAFPNWSKVNVDQLISVMFPGEWKYSKEGIESEFDGIRYFVMQESFNGKVSEFGDANVCDIMKCKSLLKFAVKELAKEGDFVLKDVRLISVAWQGHSIDVIEFIGSYPSKPMQMKGRMFIVGNNIYFFAAATDNSYFDNNVDIFLESFSL